MDNCQTHYDVVIKSMSDLYHRKNHDYGNSFDQTLDEFGLAAAAVRMSDKFNRFKTLSRSTAEVNDEKITDTLIDLANYAIMTVAWLDKQYQHDISC